MGAGMQSEEMGRRAPSAAGKQKARAKGSATATSVARTGSSRQARQGKGGPDNFRGVRQRQWGKWVAEIRKPHHGKRCWLGTFSSAVDAALAYDRAAVDIYGAAARERLNFPDAMPPQCRPASGPPAAATAAFQEREVKPVVSGTQGGGSATSTQQRGSSGPAAAPKPEEMWDDSLDDIAMYINFDAVSNTVPSYAGFKEECQFDGFAVSPLWSLDD